MTKREQQPEMRSAIKQAFAQNEGWTRRGLAEFISGSGDVSSEAFADAMAFLDAELPEHYYAGAAGDHAANTTVWYTKRGVERDRRVYR